MATPHEMRNITFYIPFMTVKHTSAQSISCRQWRLHSLQGCCGRLGVVCSGSPIHLILCYTCLTPCCLWSNTGENQDPCRLGKRGTTPHTRCNGGNQDPCRLGKRGILPHRWNFNIRVHSSPLWGIPHCIVSPPEWFCIEMGIALYMSNFTFSYICGVGVGCD